MQKNLPLFTLLAFLFFSNCTNSPSAQNEAAQKAAADKEAVVLDSISNDLEKEKADIEESVQKVEEGLKAIEE